MERTICVRMCAIGAHSTNANNNWAKNSSTGCLLHWNRLSVTAAVSLCLISIYRIFWCVFIFSLRWNGNNMCAANGWYRSWRSRNIDTKAFNSFLLEKARAAYIVVFFFHSTCIISEQRFFILSSLNKIMLHLSDWDRALTFLLMSWNELFLTCWS